MMLDAAEASVKSRENLTDEQIATVRRITTEYVDRLAKEWKIERAAAHLLITIAMGRDALENIKAAGGSPCAGPAGFSAGPVGFSAGPSGIGIIIVTNAPLGENADEKGKEAGE